MNWGTKIILGMGSFMLFIIAMAVYMFSVQGNDALVEEDYYEKGINYNQEFDAKKNVRIDHAQPTITVNHQQLIIQLKDSAAYEVKLMRPSSKQDDLIKKGSTIANQILVNTESMHPGRWFLEIRWTSNGKAYLFKKDITI